MRDLKSGVVCCPERRRKLGQLFWTIQGGSMNKDVFEGKWKQVRGEAKVWWGKLTDDDLDKVGGQFDVFVGLLQEKYGYSRERAQEEIEKQMNEYETKLKQSMPNS
jgi:uncharacterized protein YjbJ (UPF0337 family)